MKGKVGGKKVLAKLAKTKPAKSMKKPAMAQGVQAMMQQPMPGSLGQAFGP